MSQIKEEIQSDCDKTVKISNISESLEINQQSQSKDDKIKLIVSDGSSSNPSWNDSEKDDAVDVNLKGYSLLKPIL